LFTYTQVIVGVKSVSAAQELDYKHALKETLLSQGIIVTDDQIALTSGVTITVSIVGVPYTPAVVQSAVTRTDRSLATKLATVFGVSVSSVGAAVSTATASPAKAKVKSAKKSKIVVKHGKTPTSSKSKSKGKL